MTVTEMTLVRAERFGGPEELTVVRTAPVPRPGPGQILLRVDAAGVNFADVMRRRNDPYPFPTTLPFTPGGEVAGTVEALGDGVEGPPIGTPVFALVGHDGSTGYAQFAVADAQQVIPIPPGLSADEAAGIVVAGSTAVLTLTEVGGLQPGQTVLVEGAGGGVGRYAVQVAKLLGGTVVGAASTAARREAALADGADHVVDYTRPGWEDQVRAVTGGHGVDLALQVGGDDTFHQVLAALAPFGRIVVVGVPGGRQLSLDAATVNRFFHDPALNQSLHAFNVGLFFGLRPRAAVAALTTLIGYVASGRVTVPVGTVLPLEQAADAHRLLETRAATGKIILKPWP
jgi:NADPH:quinone reductase-like Zn-dependent oxidoreductase